MTQAELKKVLEEKVAVMEQAMEAVKAKEEEIKAVENDVAEDIEKLEEKIQGLQEEQEASSDLKSLRKLDKSIKEAQQDIQLLLDLKERRQAKEMEELSELIIVLMREHKSNALPAYVKYKKATLEELSLANSEEFIAEMDGFIDRLNKATNFSKSILIRTGFYSEKDMNYKGFTPGYGTQYSMSFNIRSTFRKFKLDFSL